MINPVSSTVSFCTLCGTRSNGDEQFCSCCGTKFNLLKNKKGNNEYIDNSVFRITNFENKIKGINYFLKIAIDYVHKGKSHKAYEIFDNMFPIVNVLFDYPSEVLNKLKKEKEAINFYLKTIDEILYKWEKFIRLNRLKRFLDLFNNLLNYVENSFKSENNEKRENEMKPPLTEKWQISKIKNTIIDFSRRYARLHLAEITEACDDNENNVLVLLKEMIRNGEIQARYFKSTRSVVFDIYNIT